MNKVIVVASNEIGTAIRTKSFLFGVLLMPIIMGGGGLLAGRMSSRTDVKPQAFAVVDRTGALYPSLRDQALQRNEIFKNPDGTPLLAPFVPSEVKLDGRDADEVLLELSDRVRSNDLFAFVEIPADVIYAKGGRVTPVLYYSNAPNSNDLRAWIESAINAQIYAIRLTDAKIDVAQIQKLQGHVVIENLGLLSRGVPVQRPPSVVAPTAGKPARPAPARSIVKAERVDPIRTMAVPAALMFTVFFVVMSSAPLLFNSVIEEKMSKISEVLLGSVSPFELMMGKLLGNVGIALVMTMIYVGGGYGVACYYGYGGVVPPIMFAALALSLLLAILLYGSLFAAVGAACSDLKDAQSLLMPVMLLAMLPAFVWLPVINTPNSPMAVGLSLFPFASPFLMLLRMSLNPGPPAWQVGLAVLATSLTALACVWASAKVFRTGLLMQGKAPTLRELVRWVFTS